jgi:signal transduction histidine kinase
LHEALDEIATQHNLKADWRVDNNALTECSPQVAEQVYKITREALINVAKHASAQQVRVQIGQSDFHNYVLIEDDGHGFDASQAAPGGHFGLHIMDARAKHIGGRIEIESALGHGTRVTLLWPQETSE